MKEPEYRFGWRKRMSNTPKSMVLCWHFWWFSFKHPYFAHIAVGALAHSTLLGARVTAEGMARGGLGIGSLVDDPDGKPAPWDRPPGIYRVNVSPADFLTNLRK